MIDIPEDWPAEEWLDETHDKRVQRGGSWLLSEGRGMLSSVRASYVPGKAYDCGFRIVFEMTAP